MITVGAAIVVPVLALGTWPIMQRLSPSPAETVYLPAFVPEGITVDDAMAFTAVGIIHNFSYLGGLTGLIAGCWYMVSKYRKYKTVQNQLYAEK